MTETEKSILFEIYDYNWIMIKKKKKTTTILYLKKYKYNVR